MKKLLYISAIFISVTASAQPAVGTLSPEITLKDVKGNPVSLSSLKGKVVLIDFGPVGVAPAEGPISTW